MHRSSLMAENVGDLTGDEIKRIHWNTESIVKEITTGRKHNPVVILDENGHPIEALPVPIEAVTRCFSYKAGYRVYGRGRPSA